MQARLSDIQALGDGKDEMGHNGCEELGSGEFKVGVRRITGQLVA